MAKQPKDPEDFLQIGLARPGQADHGRQRPKRVTLDVQGYPTRVTVPADYIYPSLGGRPSATLRGSSGEPSAEAGQGAN